MGESNTHWRENWQNQRPTRKATYRLKVADATEGAEWGHRRQERHSRREQRKKKKKTEKESERGETEQDTNDHMKRTSQEEKESDCATQKATVFCLSPPSQQSNTVRIWERKLNAPWHLLLPPLFYLLNFYCHLIDFILLLSFLGRVWDSRAEAVRAEQSMTFTFSILELRYCLKKKKKVKKTHH